MSNKWNDTLQSFIDKEVTVTYHRNGEAHTIQGKCVAINFAHMSVVIETEKRLIGIKHVVDIMKLRDAA